MTPFTKGKTKLIAKAENTARVRVRLDKVESNIAVVTESGGAGGGLDMCSGSGGLVGTSGKVKDGKEPDVASDATFSHFASSPVSSCECFSKM